MKCISNMVASCCLARWRNSSSVSTQASVTAWQMSVSGCILDYIWCTMFLHESMASKWSVIVPISRNKKSNMDQTRQRGNQFRNFYMSGRRHQTTKTFNIINRSFIQAKRIPATSPSQAPLVQSTTHGQTIRKGKHHKFYKRRDQGIWHQMHRKVNKRTLKLAVGQTSFAWMCTK